jgi:hypothetical protein
MTSGMVPPLDLMYPDVSFFSWDTVRKGAIENWLLPEWRPDYKEFFTLMRHNIPLPRRK